MTSYVKSLLAPDLDGRLSFEASEQR